MAPNYYYLGLDFIEKTFPNHHNSCHNSYHSFIRDQNVTKETKFSRNYQGKK